MNSRNLIVSLVTCLSLAFTGLGNDVYGQRFDPPRAYFTQASINKSGKVTAIREQDNFIRFYISPFSQTGLWAAQIR